MVSKIERLEEWLQKLDNLTSQDELVEICKNIYHNYETEDFHSAEYNKLSRGLLQHFGRALDLGTLKILAKAQARVSITDISVLFGPQFDKFDSYEKVIMLHGFFNSCRTISTCCPEMFELCLKLLIESARKSKEEEETDYLFLLSIENMISFFKFYGFGENVQLGSVWAMINLYLESSMLGVRDRLLGLFEKLVKNRQFAQEVLLPELLRRPWTDRNKYYLLSELINVQGFDTLRAFEPLDLFYQGLRMSLTYRHLFSPGQALVKVLLKQEVQQMHETIAEVFIDGTVAEKKVMVEHWSCLWTPSDRERIFASIYARSDFDAFVQAARVDAETFGHLVILRNIFGRQFASHGFDMVAIDGIIRDKWLRSAETSFIETQIFEIFVDNVHIDLETSSESLQFLRKFIQARFDVQDACFRANIFKKLPHLLQNLAKTSPGDPFFVFLRDIHVSGVASDIYQHQIFAVKLLQTMLTLFKSPEQLRGLQWDVSVNALMTLATTSDFDDVRLLAYELASRVISEQTAVPADTADLYQLPYPQFKVRWVIENAFKRNDLSELRTYFEGAQDVTEHSLQHMKDDPLNTIKNEVNLFKPLDCLNEFLVRDRIRLELLENDGELIELVKCVSDVIIDLINSKEQGLDFSKLDENLELLVEQSQVRSDNVGKDKKLLLHSFWHTLRACAELASNYGIYIIKTRQNYTKPLKRLLFCADIIINILVFCCHKGAIEAAAIAMGRLFNQFTRNWIKPLQSFAEEEIEPITNAFMNKVLRPLDKIQTLDIRCNRGLILLHMQVLKNDMTIGRTMRQQCIKIFIERLTNLSEKDEPKPMVPFLISLFLHDLSKYFSDSELSDDMIPFLEQIILISFYYIRSSHWNIRNAALTLFGSLIPKIMKQRSKFDSPQDEWQFVFIHFDEFFSAMPRVSEHILDALDDPVMPASSIVLYLEFLANIEVRQMSRGHQSAVILAFRKKFWDLLGHESDKIRRLAAVCFAQFHQYSSEIPPAVLALVPAIFSAPDENFKHGLVVAVTNLLKKLKSQYQFIAWPDREDFYQHVRDAFSTNFANDSSLISYYTRSYLLVLLLHLKFHIRDPIVRWLMFERPALNDFGIDEWTTQVTQVLAAASEAKERLERDISLDEVSMSLSVSLSEA